MAPLPAAAAAGAAREVGAWELLAAKAGLQANRLLLLGSAAACAPAPLRVADARCLLLLRGEAAPAPADHSMCRLDALVTWLRDTLGRFRATLPPQPAGGPSPSVVALLRLPAAADGDGGGASAGCTVDAFAVDAADAPPLIVAPALLRSLFAPAPAAPPPAAPAGTAAGAKRPRSAMEASAGGGGGVSLAVIVPYRSQPAQNREAQLARFAAYMPGFLAGVGLADYHVLVVEQSADGLKFNRGKALNVGFAIATDAARAAACGLGARTFDAFCFHDVDLLPQAPLAPWYARPAATRPLHIAGAWPRWAMQTTSAASRR